MKGKLIGLLMALMLVAQPAAALGGGLNYDSGDAPNPEIVADTTVDNYEVSWGDDPRYEDDSGSVTDLPATVNTSTDPAALGSGDVNAYTFTATDINFSAAGEFPRKSEANNDASALDASEWTTSGGTVADTTTAPGVDALDFTASTSGDTASYGNFSVTSDAEKRYFQAVYDVTDASGATQITATINDATDGDSATVYLYDASANTATDSVGANTTGEGKVMQVQIGQLSASGGDSTIDEIGSIDLSADGAGSVDLSALNAEKTGEWKFGTEYVNTDTSDDDLESNEITEATGPISVYSLETLGTTFDNAEIKGLTFTAHYSSSELADEDVSATFESDNAYPNWDSVLTADFRLSLPSAYDLSFSNAELQLEQDWAETRYAAVEVAEGVSDDTDLGNASSYSAYTSSFTSEGQTVSLDSSITTGDNYDVQVKLLLTGDEASAMQSAMGGAGLLGGGGSGGIVGWLFGLPGVVLAAVGGLYARSRGVL